MNNKFDMKSTITSVDNSGDIGSRKYAYRPVCNQTFSRY